MARSLSQPWLKDFVVELLSVAKEDDNHMRRKQALALLNEKRTVQIIRVYNEARLIVISDRHHSMSVFLTPGCYDEERSLESMKFGQATISAFHLSTVVQTGAHAEMQVLSTKYRVQFPLALQCTKISYLGGDDCAIMGQPRDIHDPAVMALINAKYSGYRALVDALAALQFPLRRVLPNYGTLAVFAN